MLQALIGYAEREQLGDADFETVAVRWLIPLDQNGKLAGGPIPLLENPDDKKPRPRVLVRPFTSPNELNQGTKSHFLCDTLERAILLLDGKAMEKAEARRVQHAYFQKLLEEASAACPDESPRLQSILTFLRDEAGLAELHRQLLAAKAKPSDNTTFSVDGASLLDEENLRAFWRNRRRQAITGVKARSRRICVATGILADTLDTTEKIKGVPGGLATGTNLISFDKDSFCSFGLEQAQNAALSAPAELKIRSALNALIENSRAQKLVFNNTVHLHWTRKPLDYDPIDILANADENAVANLLKSVHAGQPPATFNENAYYALSLSGNGARVMVRDWLESTVPEVCQHIAKWFEDLSIVAPDGVGIKHDFKFYALLYGMVRKELDELPSQVSTQLFHAALRGAPLPQSVLAAALKRQQIEPKGEDALRKAAIVARLALVKACLLRSSNSKNNNTQTKDYTMTECLNPESHDPAYLCGRLFAVFDRLQYLALGSVNAGVVERYYASASTTPALVMGRLFRNAQFHLAKAEGGVAGNVSKDFEAIANALGDAFPATLDLEGQGRFALGYYHQKAEYRRRSAERKEAEANANPAGA
ncbi:MAG TPA: type I-C CRISPR-associated protein Cas8c/Csd1 [Candidatus Paceibacterota bacterium]|nr:type I-C CRISPR-associated protein Cas8c/Csd1 [Verrucomicrobiota bacterium]HRY49612.1 type I-C CRISPR-associated protein Cas8c/Csd1 [Candidatus Paceibacterota bacterium]